MCKDPIIRDVFMIQSIKFQNLNDFLFFIALKFLIAAFTDSFRAFTDKDNILHQLYKEQICSDFYFDDLNFS